MKNKLLLAALATVFFAFASHAPALQIDGVNISPQATAAGKTLHLNGAGLRTVTLWLIPIRAYVAAFYTPAPLHTPYAVMASPGPLRFDFHFLQGVSQSQVTQAWTAQFRESATFTYPNYARDRDAFIKMFGPLKKYGIETVVLHGTETQAYDGGVLKGTIKGRDFQKAFLSLWFGTKPVMPSLKSQLLGQ